MVDRVSVCVNIEQEQKREGREREKERCEKKRLGFEQRVKIRDTKGVTIG
jgi:hypothetical protein